MLINTIPLIQSLLKKELSPDRYNWLQSVILEIKNDPIEKNLFYYFSLCSRQLKGEATSFSCIENCPGMNLIEWSRNYLLLSYQVSSSKSFDEIYKKIKVTSDLQETLALYKGLNIFPYSEDLRKSAEEGLRSNMKEVFDCVALDSLFPSQHFAEDAWNQMILKALFVDSPIYKIKNFDSRKNENLSLMVIDYALERIAASRTINPELWRCVISVENPRIIDYWRKLLDSGNSIEKAAIKLSLEIQSSEVKNKFLNSNLKSIPLQTWIQIGQDLDKQRKGIL